MQTLPDDRIEWIDVAKGLTLLLVVLHHAYQILARHGAASSSLYSVDNILGLARMPLFFAISGYLAAGILRRPWKEVLQRRVLLFLHIFVIWTVMTFAFNWIKSRFIDGVDAAPQLELLTHAPFDPLGSLWFIWALAIYFVLARAAGSGGRPFLLALSVLGSCFAFGQAHDLTYPQKALLGYAPFFLAAAFYGRALYAFGHRHSRAVLATSLVVSLAGVAFIALRGDDGGLGRGAFRLVTGLAAMILGGTLLAQLRHVPALRRLGTRIGRNSLKVYVIHSILISMLVVPYIAVCAGIPGFGYWGFLPLAVAAAAGSLLIAQGLEAMGAGWLFALPRRATGRQNMPTADTARPPLP